MTTYKVTVFSQGSIHKVLSFAAHDALAAINHVENIVNPLNTKGHRLYVFTYEARAQ